MKPKLLLNLVLITSAGCSSLFKDKIEHQKPFQYNSKNSVQWLAQRTSIRYYKIVITPSVIDIKEYCIGDHHLRSRIMYEDTNGNGFIDTIYLDNAAINKLTYTIYDEWSSRLKENNKSFIYIDEQKKAPHADGLFVKVNIPLEYKLTQRAIIETNKFLDAELIDQIERR